MAAMIGVISQLFRAGFISAEPSRVAIDSKGTDEEGLESLPSKSGSALSTDSRISDCGLSQLDFSHSEFKFPNRNQIFDGNNNIDIDTAFPDPDLGEFKPTKSLSELSFLAEAEATQHTGRKTEDVVAEIISSGIREFQTHYMSRIDEAFQLQIENVTKVFSLGLNQMYNAVEEAVVLEMISIQNAYRNRLIEFEDTTHYFDDATDAINEESKKRNIEIQSYIKALQHHVSETQEYLDSVFLKAFEDTKAKIEAIRAQSKNARHEEIQESINIANSRRWLIEDQYKKEVQKFEAQLEMIKAENRGLKEDIEYGRIMAMKESNRREQKKFLEERKRHDAEAAIENLQKNLKNLEKRKLIEIQKHHERVTHAVQKNFSNSEHYESELVHFRKMLDEVTSTCSEDLARWENTAKIQDADHNAALEGLKLAYREKVMNLVESVNVLKKNTEGFRIKRKCRSESAKPTKTVSQVATTAAAALEAKTEVISLQAGVGNGKDTCDIDKNRNTLVDQLEDFATLMEPRPNFPKFQNSMPNFYAD